MKPNWNDMPNEVKWMIVDNMDIVTRTKLKICSKSDKCLVESVPTHVQRLDVEYKSYNKSFSINELHIIKRVGGIFSKKIDDGNSYLFKMPKNLQKYKTKYLFEKFLCNLLLPGNLHIDYFCTNLEFPDKLTHTTIDAKTVGIYGRCEEAIKWLNVLSTNTKDIHFYDKNEDMLEGIGLIPVIINAEELDIKRKNDITDEQLMTFKFTKGCIEKSEVTTDGALEFIQNIASNDYPMATDIEIFTIKDSFYLACIRDRDHGQNQREEVRFCLPMNSEKEVVYYYNTRLSRFSIYVQKAGGPVQTWNQHNGLDSDDEMEEGRDSDDPTHESSDFDENMDEY